MLPRWLPLALIAIGGLTACAPPTLPAGADQNAAASNGGNGGGSGDDDTSGDDDDSTGSKKKSNTKTQAASGDDDDDSTGTGGGGGTAATSSGGASSGPPATFAAVYNGLKTSCSGCHTSGPGPAFFGADEASSYTSFKSEGASNIAAKGAHEGPALTSDQTSAINAWIAADPNAG